jgi:hypothetical protein
LSIVDEPEQEALFEIEGPDEDACVWIHSTDPRNPWTQNIGPPDKVIEVLSQWLASIDADEREEPYISAPVDAAEAEKRLAKQLRKIARPKDHRDEGGQG